METHGVLVVAPAECDQEEVVRHLRESGVINESTLPTYLKQEGGVMRLARFGKTVRDKILGEIQEHLAQGIRHVVLLNRISCEQYGIHVPYHRNDPEDHALDLEFAEQIIRTVFPVAVVSFVALAAGPRNTLLALEDSASLR